MPLSGRAVAVLLAAARVTRDERAVHHLLQRWDGGDQICPPLAEGLRIQAGPISLSSFHTDTPTPSSATLAVLRFVRQEASHFWAGGYGTEKVRSGGPSPPLRTPFQRPVFSAVRVATNRASSHKASRLRMGAAAPPSAAAMGARSVHASGSDTESSPTCNCTKGTPW